MTRPNYARRRLAALILATATAAGAVNTAPTVWEWADDPHALDLIDEAGATESTVDPLWHVPTEQTYIPGDCASLFTTAMRAGWTWNDWPKFAWIMGSRNGTGESGCIATKTNIGCTYYKRLGRTICENSYGLTQINTRGRLWDQPIAWGYPSLRDLCGLTSRDQLLDAETNLSCARRLYEVHAAVYGNGWKPWGA